MQPQNGHGEALELRMYRIQVRQDDHEARITRLEALAWKLVIAALTGSVMGGGAVAGLMGG